MEGTFQIAAFGWCINTPPFLEIAFPPIKQNLETAFLNFSILEMLPLVYYVPKTVRNNVNGRVNMKQSHNSEYIIILKVNF